MTQLLSCACLLVIYSYVCVSTLNLSKSEIPAHDLVSTNKVCIENRMALRGHRYSTISAWQPLRKLIWTALTGPKCWAHTFSIHKNWVIPTPEDSDIHHRLKKASNSHRKHQNTKARTVPIYGRCWWVWNQMVVWDFLTVLRAQDSCWEQTWYLVLCGWCGSGWQYCA